MSHCNVCKETARLIPHGDGHICEECAPSFGVVLPRTYTGIMEEGAFFASEPLLSKEELSPNLTITTYKTKPAAKVLRQPTPKLQKGLIYTEAQDKSAASPGSATVKRRGRPPKAK